MSSSPPSTSSDAPVQYEASGLARYAIAAATSSGPPGRPVGIWVLDTIMRRAQEARVDVRVDPLVVGGIPLTLVTVPRVSGRIVTTADGRLLRRVGSDNTPLCHEQLVRFVGRHLGLRPAPWRRWRAASGL